MNKDTLGALRGSIEKWEKIVAGDGEDRGHRNCPLCLMFHYNAGKRVCEGCPVSEQSGKPNCQNTPYDYALEIQKYRTIDNAPFDEAPRLRALAQAELWFLRSLLPSELGLVSS